VDSIPRLLVDGERLLELPRRNKVCARVPPLENLFAAAMMSILSTLPESIDNESDRNSEHCYLYHLFVIMNFY
jgi:hypothetical protein